MRSRVRQGFTLIELLVVIAIIAILASILFPVFAKAREKARQTTCTSQVRQLATAIQMYTQDNGSRYPGIKWNTAIETYAGSQKIFFCPSDAANDKNAPISYGYSGLLVRTDDSTGVNNTGVNEAQIKAPTEVGAIADATPSRPWADGGGLIGGGGLVDPTSTAANNAVELDPRHNGVIIGFCDGHAKFFPGKQANLKDISYGPGRAFYQAVGLGMVQNFGGGIQKVAYGTPASTVISIGGDYATMPVVMAAAEVWAGYGGKWYSRGFKGSGDYLNGTGATFADFRRAAASTHYVWGVADGTADTGAAQLAVARDAFVFIVSKNCKINYAGISGTDFDTSTGALATIFNDATYKGYSANVYQAYTMDKWSGSRSYAINIAGLGGIGTQAVTVTDDLDMVEKVAADPYGVGYCSAAFADIDKVTILDLNGKIFPNQNPKYRWLVPDAPTSTPGEFEYPLIRTLKVQMAGNGGTDSSANTTFSFGLRDAEFKNAPLFRATSYWTP
ncbi:MAG: Type II secretion system protein G precursor [bacterium ADurb.Bin429]|nr:MAG: Type II secretion system protein G precursor [bacterium ADurb.Bin429]